MRRPHPLTAIRGLATRHPVMTLATAAGAAWLFGAELIAAGLIGGLAFGAVEMMRGGRPFAAPPEAPRDVTPPSQPTSPAGPHPA